MDAVDRDDEFFADDVSANYKRPGKLTALGTYRNVLTHFVRWKNEGSKKVFTRSNYFKLFIL